MIGIANINMCVVVLRLLPQHIQKAKLWVKSLKIVCFNPTENENRISGERARARYDGSHGVGCRSLAVLVCGIEARRWIPGELIINSPGVYRVQSTL